MVSGFTLGGLGLKSCRSFVPSRLWGEDEAIFPYLASTCRVSRNRLRILAPSYHLYLLACLCSSRLCQKRQAKMTRDSTLLSAHSESRHIILGEVSCCPCSCALAQKFCPGRKACHRMKTLQLHLRGLPLFGTELQEFHDNRHCQKPRRCWWRRIKKLLIAPCFWYQHVTWQSQHVYQRGSGKRQIRALLES